MSVCSPFEGNFDDIIGRLLMRFSTMAPFIRARLTCKGIRQKCFPLNIWSSMSRVIFMPLFKKRVYRMCVSMCQWKNEWAILLIMNHWPPLGRAEIFSLNRWIVESKTNLWPGRRWGISRGRDWVDGAGLLHSVDQIFFYIWSDFYYIWSDFIIFDQLF